MKFNSMLFKGQLYVLSPRFIPVQSKVIGNTHVKLFLFISLYSTSRVDLKFS